MCVTAPWDSVRELRGSQKSLQCQEGKPLVPATSFRRGVLTHRCVPRISSIGQGPILGPPSIPPILSFHPNGQVGRLRRFAATSRAEKHERESAAATPLRPRAHLHETGVQALSLLADCGLGVTDWQARQKLTIFAGTAGTPSWAENHGQFALCRSSPACCTRA